MTLETHVRPFQFVPPGFAAIFPRRRNRGVARGWGGSPRALSRRGTRATEHGAPRRIMRVVNARLIGRWGGELSGRSIQR